MSQIKGTLPSFANPPVGEVALVGQFQMIERLRNRDFVELWQKTEFHDRYPILEEYAELPPFRESFPRIVAAGDELEFTRRRPVARYNFRSADRGEQIQIQRDRISFYWHSKSPPRPYPRFETVLENFRRDFQTFERFIQGQGTDEVQFNQCAISYSNVLRAGEGWQTTADLGRVVSFWSPEYSRPLEPDLVLEDANSLMTYTIERSGVKVARLYASLTPALVEPDIAKGVELELLVRGRPESAQLEGASAFFEMGRRQIVTTFEAITTPEMHKLWGKQ